MKLGDYLSEQQLSLEAFAGRIGAHKSSVYHYVHGMRWPHADIMRRIVAATHGAVTPNDFLDDADS